MARSAHSEMELISPRAGEALHDKTRQDKADEA